MVVLGLRAKLVSVLFLTVGLMAGWSAAAYAAPPANDDFAGAQVVGPALPVEVPASNIDATAEVGEPAINTNAVTSTVWFSWTAPASGVVVVDLCDSGFTGNDFPFEKMAVRTSFGQVPPVAQQSGECVLRFTSVAATTYYIQVDYGNDEGDFTFRMRDLTPPANDDFAGRTTVGPALPVSVGATTVDTGWEAGEPGTLGGSTNSRSVWFSWTAPSTGPVRVSNCEYTRVSGPANKRMAVYTGGTLGTLALVEPATEYCELDFQANAGTTYAIAVSGYIKGEFDFTLELVDATPPQNDDFADATVVGPALPVMVPGNNKFATVEVGEPDHSGISGPRHSVWYSWTPAANARVRIAACSKDFSARLGVFTGAALGALNQAAEQPPFAPHCRVALEAVAGTTYRIGVAGAIFDEQEGPFTLDIHVEDLPANDDFGDARVIGPALPFEIAGTTVDATREDNEPQPDPNAGNAGPSVWYRWTAPSDDATVFSACSTGEPVVLAVFAGSLLDELEHIDSDDRGCLDGSEGGRLAVAPVAGQQYSIVVASLQRDFDADFTLSVTGPAPVPGPVVKPPKKKFNLSRALRKCRKIGRKKKRVRCVKRARKKAALIKCGEKASKAKRQKCRKKVRRRFR